MADMIVVYRVMPDSGEVEYEKLEEVTRKEVEAYGAEVKELNEHSVGFGLKAVKIKIQVDENKGSDALEDQLKSNDEVGDVVVELMDRL